MKICILPNLKKQGAKELTLELIGWLEKQSIRYNLSTDDAKQIGSEDGVDDHSLFEDVDYVIVLGGDGAILRAVNLMESRQLPIIGVNLGQLGFLTELRAAELFDYLPAILENKYPVVDRCMLECSMFKEDIEFAFLKALNEIVVDKHENTKLSTLEVWLNDEHFYTYSCDALIIATPTGSTAYSLSAGGPIVSLGNQVMIMTPVCTHGFFNRSIVLSPSDKLEIRPAIMDEQYCIYIDGRKRKCHMFDAMILSVSKTPARIVSVRANGFFNSIRSKLIK